jgi:prepilin-type processing-associated H-X9-DG protein
MVGAAQPQPTGDLSMRSFVNLDGADLGIDAVSAVTTVATTGLQIRVRDLVSVVFVFEFSSGPFTGNFGYIPQDKDGADLPVVIVSGANFAFADGQAFAMGPGVGVKSGGVVAPAVCGSVIGLESIKPVAEVTTGGTGTYTLHMMGMGDRR